MNLIYILLVGGVLSLILGVLRSPISHTISFKVRKVFNHIIWAMFIILGINCLLAGIELWSQ